MFTVIFVGGLIVIVLWAIISYTSGRKVLVSGLPAKECIDRAAGYMVGQQYLVVNRSSNSATFARERRRKRDQHKAVTVVATQTRKGTELQLSGDDDTGRMRLHGWAEKNLAKSQVSNTAAPNASIEEALANGQEEVVSEPTLQPRRSDLSGQLRELAALKSEGVLSEEEFEAAKRKLLSEG